MLIIDNQVKDCVAFRLELPASQSSNGSNNPSEIKPPHESILGLLELIRLVLFGCLSCILCVCVCGL